ncbi:MAG: gamma-glutamyl-gamma-aminobutyrate hydrolase family protein [Defluviicoccus sp.]
MWLFNQLAVWRAGGRAKRLTAREPASIVGLDGLVVGGGDDIDAQLYGGHIEPTVRVDGERDALELSLLTQAIDRDLPILGVCRGAQMINVFLGGTLIGCIYDREPKPARRSLLPRKRIEIRPGSRLASVLGTTHCKVNALNHQAVDRPAAALEVVARDRDGIVQAVERAAPPFLIGVQWHPEFLIQDRGQRRLFEALVAAARRGAADAGFQSLP